MTWVMNIEIGLILASILTVVGVLDFAHKYIEDRGRSFLMDFTGYYTYGGKKANRVDILVFYFLIIIISALLIPTWLGVIIIASIYGGMRTLRAIRRVQKKVVKLKG